jgi:hypothetical protein
MGALLGAVLGVGLALLMENVERERVAVLTASSPSTQPPASTAASSPDPGNGNVSSVNQRTQAADQRADKANKNSQGRRDKLDKATTKDKPGKGKDR